MAKLLLHEMKVTEELLLFILELHVPEQNRSQQSEKSSCIILIQDTLANDQPHCPFLLTLGSGLV